MPERNAFNLSFMRPSGEAYEEDDNGLEEEKHDSSGGGSSGPYETAMSCAPLSIEQTIEAYSVLASKGIIANLGKNPHGDSKSVQVRTETESTTS